jgi:hypothetical protein
MNDIFREWLDDFIIVYIDDILIYSGSLEEHAEHFWKVFQRLRENKLYSMIWAAHEQPLSDTSEEVPMVTQLDEERRHLWELAKANLENTHKRYKDFVVKSQRKVKFQEGDEVWLNIKNFQLPKGLSHKFLGPYAGPFKVLEKTLTS